MAEQENRYWCGLDWSERRREGRILRICCIAGISDLTDLDDVFRQTRQALSLPQDYEFHAHACPEDWQYVLLARVVAAEIGLRVSVTFREHDAKSAGKSAGDEMEAMGLSALAEFMRRARIAEVACDEDLEGKKRQRPFITEGKRLYRSQWPGEKCKIHFCASKTSELIQLADVLVFGFGRLHMELLGHVGLRTLLETLLADPRNVFSGG